MVKTDLIHAVGLYKAKPPPYLLNNNYDVFRKAIHSYVDGEKLASHFGLKIKRTEPSVWLYIPKFVNIHSDRGGKCLVYLHSGSGVLIVLNKSNYQQEYIMSKGRVIIFNDRLNHIWLSNTPCKLLTCNVHVPRNMKFPIYFNY
jgi:hypothetical protein